MKQEQITPPHIFINNISFFSLQQLMNVVTLPDTPPQPPRPFQPGSPPASPSDDGRSLSLIQSGKICRF